MQTQLKYLIDKFLKEAHEDSISYKDGLCKPLCPISLKAEENIASIVRDECFSNSINFLNRELDIHSSFKETFDFSKPEIKIVSDGYLYGDLFSLDEIVKDRKEVSALDLGYVKAGNKWTWPAQWVDVKFKLDNHTPSWMAAVQTSSYATHEFQINSLYLKDQILRSLEDRDEEAVIFYTQELDNLNNTEALRQDLRCITLPKKFKYINEEACIEATKIWSAKFFPEILRYDIKLIEQ